MTTNSFAIILIQKCFIKNRPPPPPQFSLFIVLLLLPEMHTSLLVFVAIYQYVVIMLKAFVYFPW